MNVIEFADRLAVIATMHHKELAIAPILQTSLGLRVTVPPDFDSDVFGTFTRDIDRPASQIETAKLKAEKALELTDTDIAIASEGSFFPHPILGIPYNREIVMLLDRKHNFVVYGESVSPETNFSHQEVSSYEQAHKFALKIGFPDHAIIVMENGKASTKQAIHKGVNSADMLKDVLNDLLQRSPRVHLETDMRALHNPTRMANIAKATENLVRKLQLLCPNCNFVGFDITKYLKGLPCEICRFPTQVTRAHLYRCDRCHFEREELFPNGTQVADPQYCNYCNP